MYNHSLAALVNLPVDYFSATNILRSHKIKLLEYVNSELTTL